MFNRDKLGLFDLLSATWNNAFKPHWLELSLASLLMLLIPGAVSAVLQVLSIFTNDSNAFLARSTFDDFETELPLQAFTLPAGFIVVVVVVVLLGLVQIFLSTTLKRGLIELSHAAWDGKKLVFSTLFNFKAGFKASLAVLLCCVPVVLFAGIVVSAIVGVTFLEKTGALPMEPSFAFTLVALLAFALVVALLIWILPLAFVLQVFAEEPNIKVMDAMHICFERSKGFRLKIFLMLLIGTLLTMVGYLACCIGIVPAVALAITYQTGFWKALSTPGANDSSSNSGDSLVHAQRF